MKPDGGSAEVAFLGNCDKITEMTEFQAAVHGVPALRILCGHDLFAALEPLKFDISVRIHWRCAMLQAGIRLELWYREYGCGFKDRRYDYLRPLGCARSFVYKH